MCHNDDVDISQRVVTMLLELHLDAGGMSSVSSVTMIRGWVVVPIRLCSENNDDDVPLS